MKIVILLVTAALFFVHSTMAQTDTAKRAAGWKLLAFPVAARSVETSWIFGGVTCNTFRIDRNDTLSRTSNIQGLALYSMKKQLVAAINGTIYFPHENYIFSHRLSYSYFPDKYWGIGRHTTEAAAESYKFKQYYVFLHLMKKISPNFFAGVLYEQQRVITINYKPGGLFDKQAIAGRNGYLVSGLGLSTTYDNRNNAFSPDRGTYAQAIFKYFSHALGSDFNYYNLVQDVRKYIPVFKKHVVALQLYNYMNIGKNVPLRSMAAMGGDNIMRGFYGGRFRDKQQLVFQAEYRLPIRDRWGVAIFGSTGDVTDRVMDYNFKTLKYAYGGGLRFALDKKERLNLRMDYGITSTNNKGFYLQLGEAF